MSNHHPLAMPELLGHVFTYLDLEELLEVRLVAHIWDACMRESSEFSDNIRFDSELSDGAVQFFLLRLHARQNSPVCVIIETMEENPELQHRLLLPIASQLHRIRELLILLLHPDHAQFFNNALCRPAPILRRLALTYDPDPPENDDALPIYELPVNIFAGTAPYLVNVLLSELTLPPAPPPGFAAVESVEFYIRVAEDMARTINPLFTHFPRLRDMLIAIPRPIWSPDTATAPMVQGARQLEYFHVSGQQSPLVRWVQGVTGGSIDNVVIVDAIASESLELFVEQLVERPTDDLALLMTDASSSAEARVTVSSLSHAHWERTLMFPPTHHAAWVAEWLAPPANFAPRIVRLDVHSTVWPALCEGVRALPNLMQLRVNLGQECIAMGEVELDEVLVCPRLREVTLVVDGDADEVDDSEIYAFARKSLDHGSHVPHVAIERAPPSPW